VAGQEPLTASERRGLAAAGGVFLVIAGTWAALALWPGGPLQDPGGEGPARWTPLFKSLVAAFFLFFLLAGIAFGRITGSIRTDRDVTAMAAKAIAIMAPYIVLIFVAAHFIAMFGWSNLGAIIAIEGAEGLKASGLPTPAFFMTMVVMVAFLDLFIGSASAKWAVLAPILVPMMMLLGVSPEMTTAAYRMGDAAVNMASPLNPYFVLVLGFCQRWKPDFGVGGLLSVVLPYAAALMVFGAILTGLWSALELPTGPAAPAHYSIPVALSR
jgi:aminobenzoyl-glutamate transport protein